MLLQGGSRRTDDAAKKTGRVRKGLVAVHWAAHWRVHWCAGADAGEGCQMCGWYQDAGRRSKMRPPPGSNRLWEPSSQWLQQGPQSAAADCGRHRASGCKQGARSAAADCGSHPASGCSREQNQPSGQQVKPSLPACRQETGISRQWTESRLRTSCYLSNNSQVNSTCLPGRPRRRQGSARRARSGHPSRCTAPHL